MRRRANVRPYASADPDTLRIWWTDVGVHQNLTFPVHPDPVSGQHCWHQAVRVRKADLNDRHGDIFVDTAISRKVFRDWLGLTRPADQHSPNHTRRPYWLMRPLRPTKDAYRLPPVPPKEKPAPPSPPQTGGDGKPAVPPARVVPRDGEKPVKPTGTISD
jgi:hypothetical protein